MKISVALAAARRLRDGAALVRELDAAGVERAVALSAGYSSRTSARR